MNALFLKELAEKTRRGMRGRVELGKAGGGLCYGYRVVRQLQNGVMTTGEREINSEEAAVVRRMFESYAAGASPKQIAKTLNTEGVRGPQGSLWKEMNRLRMEQRAGLTSAQRELARIEARRKKLVESMEGVPGAQVKTS
jgi:site-specific DNA recombinase